MEDIDSIQGKVIQRIFMELIRNKTLIRIRLPDSDYQHLSIVTRIQKRLRNSFVLIDCPAGFKEAAAELQHRQIEIDFTGTDNLRYSFTAASGEILKDEIRIPFPDTIRRHQRRRHFRLKAPDGSTLAFTICETACREKVIDVSLGGALIALVCFGDALQDDLPFEVGDILQDVELTFPEKARQQKIHIKKAVVVRFEQRDPEAKTCCGLQFIDIEEQQLKALTDFIYGYQRRFLRNRLRVDI